MECESGLFEGDLLNREGGFVPRFTLESTYPILLDRAEIFWRYVVVFLGGCFESWVAGTARHAVLGRPSGVYLISR